MGSKKYYNTKQRNLILSFFEQNKNKCFSARSIIENSRFDIGEATVYRILAKLTGEGRLKRYAADKGAGATYQYNISESCGAHFHLKCLKCGESVCMDCSFMYGMEKHVEDEHEFLVDNTKTIIFGACKKCQ